MPQSPARVQISEASAGKGILQTACSVSRGVQISTSGLFGSVWEVGAVKTRNDGTTVAVAGVRASSLDAHVGRVREGTRYRLDSSAYEAWYTDGT